MPIIVPRGEDELFERLGKSRIAAISEEDAQHQDIYPARIGLLNLMPAPAMLKTELHWLGAIGNSSVLQVEPVFVKFDDDPRERKGASRETILSKYIPFSKVAITGLHGLIVTGDNLELHKKDTINPELLPLDEIFYADRLAEIVDWARANVRTTIYSCLASHFALKHLYGLDREIASSKIFGVFEHELVDTDSDFTYHMDDIITAPHSRWGNITQKVLGKTAIKLLATSERAGWLLAQDNNAAGGQDLFIQGHPEYFRRDLADEYRRDQKYGQRVPANYFPGDDPSKRPKLTWANDANRLYFNWIDTIYKSFSLPKNKNT